jgi:hypothetical protein
MKWWLISDDDILEIRAALVAPTHLANSYNCQDWPPGQGCRGCDGDEARKRGLYILNTGLHRTDAVPADLAIAEPLNEIPNDYSRRENNNEP